jgi:hypothetical protein
VRKNQIKVGKRYTCKVSNNIVTVKIKSELPLGGWLAVNEATGREVRLPTAGRLREAIDE